MNIDRAKRLLAGLTAGAALALALVAASEALAHSGGMAADGCHKDNKAGERHFHLPDSSERAGHCDADGPVREVTLEDIQERIEGMEQMLLEALEELKRSDQAAESEFCNVLRTDYQNCERWDCSPQLDRYTKHCSAQ